MANWNSSLPTLCEVAYDHGWDEIESTSSRLPSFRGVPVTGRNPHARFNGYGWSNNAAQSVTRDCVSVQGCAENTYYDYLKNYYWEYSSVVQNGGAVTIPTLPPRSQTTQGLYGLSYSGLLDVEGASLGSAQWDGRLLSLPNLHRSETVELDWRERRLCSKPRLKWFDSLNAWVPVNKSTQRHPYIHFINSPPKVDRLLSGKEAMQGLERSGPEDAGRFSQRRSSSSCYQSSSHESSSRKSRTVRFEPSHTSLTTVQPIQDFSEEVELPQQDWESEATLDAQSVEMGQAREDLHEHETRSLVDQPTVHVEEAFEVVVVNDDEGLGGDVKEEEEEEEEEEEILLGEEDGIDGEGTEAEEEIDIPVASEDVTDSVPLATSPSPSPVPVSDPLTPLPLAATEEDPSKTKTAKSKKGSGTDKSRGSSRSKPSKKAAPTTGPKVPRPPPGQVKPSTVRPSVKLTKPPKTKSEPKEKKVTPKPPPKPRPLKEKKVKPVEESDDDDFQDKPIPLPISGPEDMIWTPEPPENEPALLSPQPPVVVKTRSPVKKKEKLPPPPPRRPTPSPPPTPPRTGSQQQRRVSFMYTDSEDEDRQANSRGKGGEALEQVVSALLQVTALPDFPGDTSSTPRSVPGTRRSSIRSQLATPRGSLVPAGRSRWGDKRRDASLREQEEKERQAEERRKRHAQMMERHKHKKGGDGENGRDDGAGLEDVREKAPSPVLDGFLAKYCLLNSSTSEQYRYTFEQLDEGDKGYLTEEETAYGLRAINPSLSSSERTYLYRVMKLAGHQMKDGTGFKLFSILAALSQKVSRLDDWARSMMAQLDYKTLERKMFLCKTLWECNVDEDRGSISLDQLIVELRAGGVSPHHEQEVRDKLAAYRHLDFFDFLLYVPLFIMIHQTVVTDPLTVSREV